MSEVYLTCHDGPFQGNNYAPHPSESVVRIPVWLRSQMKYVGDAVYQRDELDGREVLKYLRHDKKEWPSE